MHIETLKVFCDIAATGSFSAAAERNLLTQSAVSQKMRGLEKHFGVLLIDRGKPVSLTDEGRVFLKSAEKILDTYGDIPERLLKASGVPRGEVRVATVPNVGLYDLAEVRAGFAEKYPSLVVKTSYLAWEHGYEAVADQQVDFALVPYPEKRDGFTVETVWHEKLVLVCPREHRLARYGVINVRDLRGERFVWYAADRVSSTVLEGILEKANVDVDVVLQVRNPDAAKRAIAIEGVVGFLPESSIHDEAQSLGLSVVELSSQDFWLPIGIVRKKGAELSLAAAELITVLRDHGGPVDAVDYQ